jgi:hypothetical protein
VLSKQKARVSPQRADFHFIPPAAESLLKKLFQEIAEVPKNKSDIVFDDQLLLVDPQEPNLGDGELGVFVGPGGEHSVLFAWYEIFGYHFRRLVGNRRESKKILYEIDLVLAKPHRGLGIQLFLQDELGRWYCSPGNVYLLIKLFTWLGVNQFII